MIFLTDIRSLGLKTAQGLQLTSACCSGPERPDPRLVEAL